MGFCYSRFSLATVLIVGGIGGLLFWGGFNWAMEVMNTESFCISCHEMRDNPYKEMQNTVHFKNRSGVRATCPDCHVPHEWLYKMRRKIQASNEVLHKIMGTVDTPEKYEAHRLKLAEHVWASMKATDSHECRNCHSANSMDPHKQTEAAVSDWREFSTDRRQDPTVVALLPALCPDVRGFLAQCCRIRVTRRERFYTPIYGCIGADTLPRGTRLPGCGNQCVSPRRPSP
jgi:cytochrome c-type protein NapC